MKMRHISINPKPSASAIAYPEFRRITWTTCTRLVRSKRWNPSSAETPDDISGQNQPDNQVDADRQPAPEHIIDKPLAPAGRRRLLLRGSVRHRVSPHSTEGWRRCEEVV